MHEHQINEKNIFISVILNLTITIAQFIGGFFSNSLALISDAIHNLSDGISLFLSYIALKISRKDANYKKTFGYKRIEIITALFNAITLVVICIFLFKEAIERFYNPEKIDSLIMLIVATIGLLANLISVILLHKDKNHNINIKSAYLHLLGDTISSVAVIIGGILIYFFNIYWIDPIITILIALYIIKEAYSIIVETVNILMQNTPKNIDIDKIKENIEKFEFVDNIHHVHVWKLSDYDIHFEAHIDIKNDINLSKADTYRHSIEELLKNNYSINHTTLQLEHNCCKNKEIIIINHENSNCNCHEHK